MYKNNLFLFATFFVFSHAGIVDDLPKCMIADNECLRAVYESVFRKIGKSGIAELKIPPVDPIALKNISLVVPDLMDITLIEGVAEGVKNCIFDKIILDIKEGKGTTEVTCNITVKGRYKLFSTSPLIKTILGGNSIHGEGNGKVTIKKLWISFDYTWYPQKRDDGKTYIKNNFKDVDFIYDIKGYTRFDADSLYMGNQEISQLVLPILNDNNQYAMKNFGKPFIQKAMEFYFFYVSTALENFAMENFIIDMENVLPYSKP